MFPWITELKITAIRIYRSELPYVGGVYAWGAGNAFTTAWASVVVIETDAGISGCGEFTPCGENYMEAHSHGVESAARRLAPALLGEDPRQVGRIEQAMDHAICGHNYAKAPFDAACWDILGKATEQPLWMLMGGKLTDGAPMYRVIPQGSPEQAAEQMNAFRYQGYRQFQIKVGANWREDIDRLHETMPLLATGERVYADANRGWRVDDALRVARATRNLDYVFEQPCRTYEECLQVRRRIDLPMKLDEVVTDMRIAHRIVQDCAAEIVCLKISNLGGLSKARRVRDYLVDQRIPVVAEDSWGGEIATAALSHFAASTPNRMLASTTDLHNYNTRATGLPAPKTDNGRLFASDSPGLGVEPNFSCLGEPVAAYGKTQ